MNSIELKANAKVNIGLQVKDKRDDGYHNIHTVFQELDLHDTIILEKIDKGWKINISESQIPQDDSNSCIQAYLAIKKQFPAIDGISITLKKRIPSGAGLGGGSSDAAAALKGLKEIYGLTINNEDLLQIAGKIGADVPFFLLGGTQIGNGIGDILSPINKPVIGFYLLVIPDIFISTSWAYKALKKHLKEDIDRINFADILEGNNLSNVIFDNDFERIVIPTYPKIGEIKNGLIEAGANYASLSGSGSTVFGIFDEEARAKKAESYFQKQYLTFLCRPANI